MYCAVVCAVAVRDGLGQLTLLLVPTGPASIYCRSACCVSMESLVGWGMICLLVCVLLQACL